LRHLSPGCHDAGARMTSGRRFVDGAIWMAAGNWVEQAVNFAVFVILARLLGTEAFGVLAMASVIVVLSEFLVRETLGEGIIAAKETGNADQDAAFWLLVGAGLVLTMLMVAAAGPLADLYHTPEVRGLVLALSPTVLLIALTAVPVAILRREMRFRVLSIRAALGVIAGGAVGIGMAIAGYGVWSLAGQRVTQVAVNVALAWGAVRWRPGFNAGTSNFARAGRFGGQVIALRAAELVATQAPILILGAVLGPAATGLYALAWRIIELVSFLVITPIRMVAQPAFAAVARDGGHAGTLLTDIARFTGVLAFPLFAGIAAVAAPALLVFFGPAWTDAAPALAVLAIAGAYFSIEKLQQALCLAAARAGALTIVAWVNAALITVLTLVTVRWGITVVGVAVVLGYLLPWAFRFRIAASVAGLTVRDLILPYIRPGAAALVMAAVTCSVQQYLPAPPVYRLAAAVLAGIAVYALLAVGFMPDRLRLARDLLRRSRPTDKAGS
jgi:O-antigen/teichoic acid export membrane protein